MIGERLTARLWGGNTIPALESLDLRWDKPQPKDTYKTTALEDEDVFRSMLNSNQLKALDNWGPMRGCSLDYKAARVPVYGSHGGLWYIEFYRHRGERLHVRLVDPRGHGRCIHARTKSSYSCNGSRPYIAAIALLCKVQDNEIWVNEHAGA